MGDSDELRDAAKDLLHAEESHRMAPTLDNAARLARARRKVEEALGEEQRR